jgi:DNA-binding CsgD family transcriptional regulator
MNGAAPLLERESELAALEAALALTLSGGGRCVVVEGAAGIGKTSLLRAVRGRVEGSGMRLLTARGSELEQTLPYGIVRQLFERAVARATADERDDALSGAAARATPLFSAAPTAAPAAADEDAAFAVMHGLYWLAANLAEREPLVLTVDDLHWADAASLRWLAYLARRIEGLPLLALATVRPVEAETEPALAGLLADPATLIIRPSALTHEAAAVILGERVSGDATGDLSAAAHAATAGNPLLLRELAGALADEGRPTDVADVRRLASEVVSRRVRLELARLGPAASALARAVAVVGEDATCAACLPQLAGLDADEAASATASLARAELLRRDAAVRFAHPLVRQAVYDDFPEPERRLAHARAAVLLREQGAPIDRVAAQLTLAPPNGDPATVERLRQAARQALAAGAADSARTYLRRALEEPPPEAAVRTDVLVELAAAEGLLGHPDVVAHLTEALTLVGDPARRATLRRELARGLIWRSQEPEAVAQIEAALSDAPVGDAALRRTLEADFFTAALRMPELHEAAQARLAELEIEGVEDGGSRMLLALKAYAMMLDGKRLDDSVRLAERALAGGLPTEEAPSWSLWGAVSALLHADRHEVALRVVSQAVADASRRGAAYLFSGASMVRASIVHMTGNLVEAEADARASVDAVPDRRALIMPRAFGLLAEILVQRGMLDAAAATLRDAGADGALPATFGTVPLLSARGLLNFARGDFAAATADARACGGALEAVGVHNPALARWRSHVAVALLGAGDGAEAFRLATEELELARRWGSARPLGRALRVLGLARGGKAGLALLRESLDVLDTSPAQLERAHTQVELGAALRRAGKRVDARSVLRGGAELAQRCGAGILARQAHEELLAAGAKPRSTALSGVESLTPSERRVATMAAEGLGNREIAQALFVTLRTVEMHLSNAFRKLDISSRTQLVDVLTRPRPGAALAD